MSRCRCSCGARCRGLASSEEIDTRVTWLTWRLRAFFSLATRAMSRGAPHGSRRAASIGTPDRLTRLLSFSRAHSAGLLQLAALEIPKLRAPCCWRTSLSADLIPRSSVPMRSTVASSVMLRDFNLAMLIRLDLNRAVRPRHAA